MIKNTSVIDSISVDEVNKMSEGLGLQGYLRWRKIYNPEFANKYFSR